MVFTLFIFTAQVPLINVLFALRIVLLIKITDKNENNNKQNISITKLGIREVHLAWSFSTANSFQICYEFPVEKNWVDTSFN